MSEAKCTIPRRSLAACIDRVKIRTHQFARRQETWFRSLSECRFVDMNEQQTPAQVAEQIQQLANSESRATANARRDSTLIPSHPAESRDGLWPRRV